MELNTFICGDCIEQMKLLPNDSVDMCFTSPPYNCGNSGKNKDMYKNYSDDLSNEDYFNLLNSSLTEMLRLCKGLVFINLNYMVNNTVPLFKFINENSMYLKEVVVWDKMRAQPPIGNILAKRHELIFLFTKNKDTVINTFSKNKGEDYRNIFGGWISNVARVSIDSDQTEFSKEHRASFPLALPKIFIDIYTEKGGIVLDPFCGLGTTAIACYELGRNFIGIERDDRYIQISKERLSSYQLQPKFL